MKIIIAKTVWQAKKYAKRKGYRPEDVILIGTDTSWGEKLYGRIIEVPEDVEYVWNWWDGRHTDKVLEVVQQCLIGSYEEKTKVVHCQKEPYDVLIDRTTKWGNPWKIGKDGNRDEEIEMS